MDIERRARIIGEHPGRNVPIPRERAVIHANIGDERNEEAIDHSVDEGRALFDGQSLPLQEGAVGFLWHGLDLVR